MLLPVLKIKSIAFADSINIYSKYLLQAVKTPETNK
jgi:hypothetical protein